MSQVGLGKQTLIGQFGRELRLRFLDFFSRELGGINSSGDLRIKIASYHTTGRNRRHNPERDPGKSLELERRVERNDERSRQSQQYMNVQPVSGAALPHQPGPVLTKRIKKDCQEDSQPEKAELQSDYTTGLQQVVLIGERTLGNIEGVIHPTINS